jgi:hypothetical protein
MRNEAKEKGSERQTEWQRKFQAGNWGAPPNPEREKQFLAGKGGARTQTETEQRARPNNNEQREAGPRKPRAGSDRCCREIQSGKKQDRRTTACGKKDSARKDRPCADEHELKNKLGRHCCALGALERKTKKEKHVDEPATDD